MAGIDDLPPDQRAVLQLVLGQGRRYDELASTLNISSGAVRSRAVAGAETLAPPPAGVSADERGDVVDVLLGQPGADLDEVSPEGRAWGERLREALRPLAPDGLPELAGAAGAGAAPSGGATGAGADTPRRSLLGGALLLGGLAILVTVLLIVLIGGGDDNKNKSQTNASSSTPTASSSSSSASSSSSSASSTKGFNVSTQVNMRSPSGGRAVAVAQLLTQGKQAGFALSAQNLSKAPGTYLGVWV